MIVLRMNDTYLPHVICLLFVIPVRRHKLYKYKGRQTSN